MECFAFAKVYNRQISLSHHSWKLVSGKLDFEYLRPRNFQPLRYFALLYEVIIRYPQLLFDHRQRFDMLMSYLIIKYNMFCHISRWGMLEHNQIFIKFLNSMHNLFNFQKQRGNVSIFMWALFLQALCQCITLLKVYKVSPLFPEFWCKNPNSRRK